MCCLFLSMTLFGPRLAFLVYWLLFPLSVNLAFDSFILPLLGFIFLPWTILMYVIVFPVVGFDWFLVGLGFLADIASYGASAYSRRRVPGYVGP